MAARGHGKAARWTAVGALVAALLALPAVIGALPASDSAVSAAELRARALASEALGFSGYAVAAGSLALPVTDQIGSVADLFSDRTSMRVCWSPRPASPRRPGGRQHRATTPASTSGR